MVDKTNKALSKTGSLREQQRAERKVLILHAAFDLLVQKGYYEMSMDEVAAEVGISKGALYLHFASKEELVFQLIEQEISKFLALVDQIIEQDINVRAKLESILLETIKGIQAGQQFLLALNAFGLQRGVIRERLEEQVTTHGLVDRLTRLFEQGQAAGEFNTSLPTAVMVSMFLALMAMFENEQLMLDNQLPPEKQVQSVSQIFFHGVLATP